MSRWLPCKRQDFLRRLGRLGFTGPFAGGKHPYVRYGHYRLAIPRYDELSVPKLREMIREVEGILGKQISPEEWNSL